MRKYIISLGLCGALSAISIYTWKNIYQVNQLIANEKPKIIILNGPAASGKSTIQKKLIDTYQTPWLKIGIDFSFVRMLSDKYIFNQVPAFNENDLVVRGRKYSDRKGPFYDLEIGPHGRKIISGMNHSIASYAAVGNNLVVDYIVYDPDWLRELVPLLSDYKVYFVGVRIPLDVVMEREKKRASSPLGFARSTYDRVHYYDCYDIEIDTSTMNPDQCAAKIMEFVHNNDNPQAFKILERHFAQETALR